MICGQGRSMSSCSVYPSSSQHPAFAATNLRIWVEQTRRERQDSQKLLEFLLPMRTHDFPPNAYPSFFSPTVACTQVPRIAAATMEFLHQIK
jgi:hypothetical protein